MLLHLLPRRPVERLMLHRLVKEVERAEPNHDVARPAPRALLDLVVECGHGVLPTRRPVHTEHEDTCQHLVEDDAHCPHIDLVAVTRATAPVRIKLLWRHHKWGAFERLGSARLLRAQLARVPQISDLDDERFSVKINV